jgi:hypothetical protein
MMSSRPTSGLWSATDEKDEMEGHTKRATLKRLPTSSCSSAVRPWMAALLMLMRSRKAIM